MIGIQAAESTYPTVALVLAECILFWPQKFLCAFNCCAHYALHHVLPISFDDLFRPWILCHSLNMIALIFIILTSRLLVSCWYSLEIRVR